VYKEKYNIGSFNRRVIFENWAFTQDIGGGSPATIVQAAIVWAKVENRSGSQFVNQAQQQWQYDCKIVMRYNEQIVSNTTIVYNNARYTINSLEIDEEGPKRFMIARCSKRDGELVSSGTITPIGMAYVYNYDGIGGETTFTTTDVINKTVFGAYKDGIAFEVIYTGTPNSNFKQVLYTPASGSFLWSQPFEPEEQGIIQYV
jgi:SPP1 family predicted phage head-tail adaptor